MLKDSFSYELKKPIEVAIDGKMSKAYSVEIFAPTGQVFVDANTLTVEFEKARKNAIKESSESLKDLSVDQLAVLKDLSDKQVSVEKVSDPSSIIKQMQAYGADLVKCHIALANILTAGNKIKPICLIDTAKMTKPIFDELSHTDIMNIMGLYIENFLDTSRLV